MSASTDAQRLIALSIGKIAHSRQQRGGISFHKNLLIASVLHKARTTYMMDNFQTLLANKRSQAEREAAAKRIVENPVNKRDTESMDLRRGVTDRGNMNTYGVLNGRSGNSYLNKENVRPDINNDNMCEVEDCSNNDVFESIEKKKCSGFENINSSSHVTGNIPFVDHNCNMNNSLPTTCVGGKRKKSFVDCDSVTEAKKARLDDDNKNYDYDYVNDLDSKECAENMQTESAQVTNLVDIFSTGFNGLCKNTVPLKSERLITGNINVYVSADRQISGHQYVSKDFSCANQKKDNVKIPIGIALAV